MSRRASLARLPAAVLFIGAPVVFGADAKPILRVGEETVSSAEFVRRIARLPDFQRAALGSSPSQLKRQVLNTMLVPELLYADEAERLKLADRPAVRNRTREVLRAAMEHALRAQASAKTPVTADDIRGYFEANRSRFETPRRVHIWRILLDDELLAKKIIVDSQAVSGIQRWSQYARDSSLDTATRLRNGDLGFVHPDGNTDTPTLRVDPALFRAADTLRDGALATEPIKEGLHWAVLWRRGSMQAIDRTLDQEQGSIRQVLERKRAEEARTELLLALRARYVSQLNSSALESISFDVQELPPREAPVFPAHPAAAGSSTPETRERGTR